MCARSAAGAGSDPLVMAKKAKPSHYAVRVGRIPGIYATWAECEAQVKGFKGAKFKGFTSQAEAAEFIAGDAPAPAATSAAPKKRKRADVEDDNVRPRGDGLEFHPARLDPATGAALPVQSVGASERQATWACRRWRFAGVVSIALTTKASEVRCSLLRMSE